MVERMENARWLCKGLVSFILCLLILLGGYRVGLIFCCSG